MFSLAIPKRSIYATHLHLRNTSVLSLKLVEEVLKVGNILNGNDARATTRFGAESAEAD